jgi:cellulose synthase/poly-beta-1,6-N-acetylglucosamine synthase-like glycosyltransferase
MPLPESTFWLSIFLLSTMGAIYTYLGYPLLLLIWSKVRSRKVEEEIAFVPAVTLILPVHNEARNLPDKLENLDALSYPPDRLQILIISDASSDGTVEISKDFARTRNHAEVITLHERGGKAGALNVGLTAAAHDIIVFTDAAILLESGSLRALVESFADPKVGCASGEDRIEGGGGEALYGRYELALRRGESAVGSIVGASGSFYAQRRELCEPFPEGVAPDFLSVLRTVERGFRAVTVPKAVGSMRATTSHGQEFQRKVRTLVRGMTGLFENASLLNPLKSGTFAFFLLSHKVMRWTVPWFLLAMLISHLFLLDSRVFQLLAIPHFGFYLMSLLGLWGPRVLRRWFPIRVAAYFVTVHAAILVAWGRYLKGVRQEVWSPTVRG